MGVAGLYFVDDDPDVEKGKVFPPDGAVEANFHEDRHGVIAILGIRKAVPITLTLL